MLREPSIIRGGSRKSQNCSVPSLEARATNWPGLFRIKREFPDTQTCPAASCLQRPTALTNSPAAFTSSRSSHTSSLPPRSDVCRQMRLGMAMRHEKWVFVTVGFRNGGGLRNGRRGRAAHARSSSNVELCRRSRRCHPTGLACVSGGFRKRTSDDKGA